MTYTKVVWPGLKAFWFSKDNPTEQNKKKEKKSWKTILQSGQEWTSQAQLGQLKSGQGGKGLLQSHL